MSQLTEPLTVTSPGPNPTGPLRPATRLAKPYHFRRNGLYYMRLRATGATTEFASVSLKTSSRREANYVTFHIGVKLLELLIESTQLVEMKREHAGNAKLDGEFICLTPEWAEKLCNRAYALAEITPRYQPMIVPPREWTGMIGGGYWAKGRKPVPLIRVRSKKALQRYKDVSMPEVYKAVNTAQASAWKVNAKVLEVAKEVMQWKHVPIDKFPTTDKEALPVKPANIDEDPEVLKAWKKAASTVYRKDRARVSRRLSYEFIVEQATKFSEIRGHLLPVQPRLAGPCLRHPLIQSTRQRPDQGPADGFHCGACRQGRY